MREKKGKTPHEKLVYISECKVKLFINTLMLVLKHTHLYLILKSMISNEVN